VGVDWLGSTRTVTDATGAVVSRHDYAPTGKEIPAGLCGRASGNFYGAAELWAKTTLRRAISPYCRLGAFAERRSESDPDKPALKTAPKRPLQRFQSQAGRVRESV
jgi:hypothetical protein